MTERLYGVVLVILLIALIAGLVVLHVNGRKIDRLLASYPSGNPQTDKQLDDSITKPMMTTASLSASRKALVGKTYANGCTPLHYASAGDHVSMVRLLLAQKASVNAQDTNGWTPLHWAAAKGSKSSAELLISHNADVNIQDAKGVTPLKLAERSGHKELTTLLSQHGGMD